MATAFVLLLCLDATTAFMVGGTMARAQRPSVQMQVATSSAKANEVQSLLSANRARVDKLGSIAPDMSELARLRFALAFTDQAECEANLRETVAWRKGAGKSIVESAAKAYAESTAGGKWDNEPVRLAAPGAAAINKYITPTNILTLPTAKGDLVYVIRASLINDKKLMDDVSVDLLVDFLLYVKEIHALTVNARSEQTGRLCQVIFANDISGTRAAPDKRFSQALTASSKSYEKLYPSLAGPTMILNLPFILQAFVGLFKPLFPKSVQARLKFVGAPVLASLKELTPLTNDMAKRNAFLSEVEDLLR